MSRCKSKGRVEFEDQAGAGDKTGGIERNNAPGASTSSSLSSRPLAFNASARLLTGNIKRDEIWHHHDLFTFHAFFPSFLSPILQYEIFTSKYFNLRPFSVFTSFASFTKIMISVKKGLVIVLLVTS